MMMVSHVVLVFFAFLPANLSDKAPGQAADQAKVDLSGKLSADIQSFEHISSGARGSSRGGGWHSNGHGSSAIPRTGSSINPLYLGRGAQNHNAGTRHSAAHKRHSASLGPHHGLEILLFIVFTYLAT